ncbi:hypothetical protein F5883DRAFT_702063 [Diaporthe sp. PMI_573]|nr:hypothetical protein F5883DRAFT_702063 [Diaporthaceae sp. PMI_573]
MNVSRDKPTQTAMTILASSWMRRLWTLQEAFLSRQLHFAFGERRMDWHNLISYDNLDGELGVLIENELRAPLTGTVKDMLTQNIMGQDDRGDGQTSVSLEKAAFWIASVWSAARWRTTSNHAHETLALATLLVLKYQGTQIEEAGLTKLKDVKDKLRDQLVTEFWKTFHNTHRGAIPPGMIFLPGAKVEGHQGFGWAPRTWLSAHEIDYPNPLNHWTGKTDLPSTGLEVKYPGFLLHTIGRDTRSHILGMDQDKGQLNRHPRLDFWLRSGERKMTDRNYREKYTAIAMGPKARHRVDRETMQLPLLRATMLLLRRSRTAEARIP